MPRHYQDYALESVGPCLRLVNAKALLPVLKAAMSGWPITPCTALHEPPDVCVWRHPQGYWQEAPALPEGVLLNTAVGTACSVIADAAGAYFYRHPELVGLHCGSVEMGGKLVIFPDAHRAGKSTLTAAFAAAGQRVFGDDVLALNRQGKVFRWVWHRACGYRCLSRSRLFFSSLCKRILVLMIPAMAICV
ncbi:hypothetical protein P4544_12225 [Halomonas sp. LY9]